MNLNKNFNLVLSGGGALGYAHVGVVEKLYENSLIPKEIIGTSMGSIVGAIFALKLSKSEFIRMFNEFSNMFKWLSISFSNSSAIDNKKIYKIFDMVFADKKIKDMPIDIKIISTNFDNAEIRVFDKNDDIYIKDAILSSMSIPGLFQQIELENKFYVDGFIGANLPINYVSDNSIDTLAIDVMSIKSIKPFKKSEYKFFGHTKAIIKSLNRTIRLMAISQTKEAIKNYKGGNLILIQPNLQGFRTASFHKYKRIKNIGYLSVSDKVI